MPNFTGVWKADLQRSRLLGPVPKGLLVKINHSEPELTVEMFITKPDDIEDRLSFRGLASGEEIINSVNGVEVRNRCRWENTELLIESWMKMGEREITFRDYWSLSNDGRVLTMEHRGDALAGQITFLDKAEQAHAGKSS